MISRVPVITVAVCLFLLFSGCTPDGSKAPVTEISQHYAAEGAGSSFAAVLYERWTGDLNTQYGAPIYLYDPVGSGLGVQQFIEGDVDFAASDLAMTDEQIDQVEQGVVMIPVVAGMVVLAYNLGEQSVPLKLSREVYTSIFSGAIRAWNDPAIAVLNPSLKLPDEAIYLVTRKESSGATYALSKHLSKVDPAWHATRQVEWPIDTVEVEGNEGAVNKIRDAEFTLGYVEYGVARKAQLAMAVLENKAGQFVSPSIEAGVAALEGIGETIPRNLRLYIPDPEGKRAYPIVTLSWLLAYRHYLSDDKARAVKDLLHYSLTDGQQEDAEALGFVPLPEKMLALARAAATDFN